MCLPLLDRRRATFEILEPAPESGLEPKGSQFFERKQALYLGDKLSLYL